MNDSTTSATAPHPRRRKSRRGLIFALLVIVAAGGWYGVHKYLDKGSDEGEYLFAAVTTGDIEDLVTSTGTLQPRDYVDVGAQVSGQIEKINVEVGDVVTAGTVLAEIDATTAEAKVEANRAQMRSSQTNLATQRANHAKAQRDYQRQVNLLADDATTKETVLNAKTTLDNAERSIASSEATIAQQEANMRIEANNLKYTQIIAPISGTIMTIDVKMGQTLNATQQAPKVMRIANLSTMTVQSEVSEADVAKLYKGIPVYFTTLGGQNRRWYGTLKRIEPTPKVQNSVVLYNALFDVENDNGSLMPSMTAQVFFVSAEAKGVLMMPMAAIQQGQQIARELAAKEREKNGGAKTAGAPGGPGGPGGPGAPGAAGAPGAGGPGASGAAPAAAVNPVAAAGRDRAAAPGAPGATASAASGPSGAMPGPPIAGTGPRGAGSGPPGAGRPGGFGGFNGGQAPSAEQMEQFRRMRGQGGGDFNGPRPGGGAGAGAGASGMAAGGGTRAPQQRRGTVMVKQADGTIAARQVTIGVTNRVHGQVLTGLKEGEEVVVGKREVEAAAAAATQQGGRNNNGGLPGGGLPGGGFPGGGGGGGPPGGGGGRPF